MCTKIEDGDIVLIIIFQISIDFVLADFYLINLPLEFEGNSDGFVKVI